MNRRLLIVLLIVPLAAVAALAAAVLVVPTDRIAAVASARAAAALGRDVRIDRIELDLFPKPGVALEGVAVEGAGADAPPLATVRRAVLRLKLLPLLARRIVVDEIALEHPRLLVSVDADGRSNLPLMDAAGRDTAEADGGRAGGDVAFLVDRVRISDGRLAYRDERTGTAVRLDGLDQRLHLAGELRGGELARIRLEGEVRVDALGAVLPEQLPAPIQNVRLRITHDAVLDRTADSLALERLALRVQEVELEGAGTLRALSRPDARSLSLRLAAGPVDIGGLIRSLPQALLDRMMPEGQTLPDADGTVTLRVLAEGPLGADTLPRVEGTLDLEAVRLGWGGAGDLLSGLGGRIGFTLDSVAAAGLEGRLMGEPLAVTFAVRDLAAPVADTRVRTALDLAKATSLGFLPDSLGARGRASVDLAVRAPLLQPERGSVNGDVVLDGVSAAPPGLLVPVRVEAGRLAFRGSRMGTDDLRLRLGESDLTLDLAVEGWLPLVLGDSATVPTARAEARSRLLDLDEILGTEAPEDTVRYSKLLFARLADRPVDGRPVSEVAAEAGLGLPPLPPVVLEGRYRAETLRRNGLELRNVDVAVTSAGDRLELSDARFELMGGGVQLAGRVGLAAGGEAAAGAARFPAVLSYQLRDIGAAPFFDRFTPFRDHLEGTLLMAGTLSVTLDEFLLPVRESVVAEGTLSVSGGRLANWPALRALGQKLGLARFDTLTLRDWTGTFRVTGPTVTLSESVLASDELTAQIAGAFDFAGRLDLAATLQLDPSLAGRIRGEVGAHLAAAGGQSRQLPIGVRITGPATSPDVSLDLSAAARNVVAEARKAAEAEARQLAEQAARNAAARLLPSDSASALPTALPADSARAKLETQLKNLLKRLIRN